MCSKHMSEFVCQQLDELEALFKKKHEQYSSGADELANFRRGALLEHHDGGYDMMYDVAKGYLNKHIAFLYDHGIADKTEESLRDMVVYGLIMLYMVKKHKEWLAQVKE